MALVRPLRAIRYDTSVVADLGGCLAPPYDVISDSLRERLYSRDLRNVVRVDYGVGYEDDVDGVNDRYTRAAAHLASWQELGVLVRDPRPAIYVHEHTFTTLDGRSLTRRGLFARVRALPWAQSDVLPHEHTLRGPKEDRLRLMRATGMQTSGVFLLWDVAPGVEAALDEAMTGSPAAEAETEGEVGLERHRLAVVDGEAEVTALVEALAGARLYMADGHHRFETAAAYAAERRAADPGAGPDADHQWTLAYMCAAGDPAMELLPTHRLVRPATGVPGTVADLVGRLGGAYMTEPMPDLASAAARSAEIGGGRGVVAVAVAAADGAAVLVRPRPLSASPRERLDVTVVERDLLLDACGLDAERIGGGALAYARTVEAAAEAVASGAAALAIVVNPCSTQEMIDVSDAAEQMPQKSTYFYPKVPTGLVISPL